MVAHTAYLREDGEMLNPSFDRYSSGPLPELADLEVGAYFARSPGDSPLYGVRHTFKPYALGLAQAESIVKVLRKLDKGMTQLCEREGYLADDDFAGYLIRVSRVLGLQTYWVRNTTRGFQVSGEKFRRVDGSSMQDWVRTVTGNRGSELVR